MICRRCRTELPAGAHYCHRCALTGAELYYAAAAPTPHPIPRGEVPPAAPGRVVVLEGRPALLEFERV